MRGSIAVALLICGTQLSAQPFPPGYMDPGPLLAAAAEEIGEASLRCVTFSGTGYAGAVGQTFENAVNVDWPRIDSLANYSRTINWEMGTSKETFDRKPGLSPAAWKYGLGWQDGTPTQVASRQTHIVNGRYAWHIDGDGEPVAVPPELAELYRLDLWLNPPGFLKAARLPGANPVAFWRWEQIEKGRDGNVVQPEKVHVVAITMLGKYRVDATINSQNQITRIKTTVSEPALGDFNIEHESTNQTTFGNVKWPTVWHSHHGWDDNWQFYRLSTGHNGYGGNFPNVQPNACGDSVPVPPSVAQARFETAVTVEEIADGVYLLGGGPANSYMVEFSDFVAVFEAPGNEERSLAVIEAIAKLAPGKPIRWLVSSHPHFDHIGGLRTYLHIGATVVAHMKNIAFLNSDVLSYEPRTVESGHRVPVAAHGGVRGLQLRGRSGKLRDHGQPQDSARLLRAALAARRRHADGVSAGRAHRVSSGPLRYARGSQSGAAARDAQPRHSGRAPETRCRDAGARARQARAVEHLRSGVERAERSKPLAVA